MCYGEVLTIYSALKTGLNSYKERPDTDPHGHGTGKEFLTTLVSSLSVGRLSYAVNDEVRLLFDTDIYPMSRRLVRQVDMLDAEHMTAESAAAFAERIVGHIDNQVDMGFIDGRFLTLLAYEDRWEAGSRHRPIADELRSREIGYRD